MKNPDWVCPRCLNKRIFIVLYGDVLCRFCLDEGMMIIPEKKFDYYIKKMFRRPI